jgi:hypothetical protein
MSVDPYFACETGMTGISMAMEKLSNRIDRIGIRMLLSASSRRLDIVAALSRMPETGWGQRLH